MTIQWTGAHHHQWDQNSFRNTSLLKRKSTPDNVDLFTHTHISQTGPYRVQSAWATGHSVSQLTQHGHCRHIRLTHPVPTDLLLTNPSKIENANLCLVMSWFRNGTPQFSAAPFPTFPPDSPKPDSILLLLPHSPSPFPPCFGDGVESRRHKKVLQVEIRTTDLLETTMR